MILGCPRGPFSCGFGVDVRLFFYVLGFRAKTADMRKTQYLLSENLFFQGALLRRRRGEGEANGGKRMQKSSSKFMKITAFRAGHHLNEKLLKQLLSAHDLSKAVLRCA